MRKKSVQEAFDGKENNLTFAPSLFGVWPTVAPPIVGAMVDETLFRCRKRSLEFVI